MTTPLHDKQVVLKIADISTAETLDFYNYSLGKIIQASVVIGGAITSANSIVTILVNNVSVGTVTVAQSGSGARSKFSTSLDAPIKDGDVITVANDGGSTNAVLAHVTLVIRELTGG